MTLILDIETIPTKQQDPASDEVNPLLQKVVCLSYVEIDKDRSILDFKATSIGDRSEKDIIGSFLKKVKKDDFVVTWGGRGFDIPVLIYRSMLYADPRCGVLLDPDFIRRYNAQGHFDLQDEMTLYGAVRRLRLDHAAASIGLPGKLDTKASEVRHLESRNRYPEISTYCVTDVVQTAILFSRWAYINGGSLTAHNAFLERLEDMIEDWDLDTYTPPVLEGVKKVIESCSFGDLTLSKA